MTGARESRDRQWDLEPGSVGGAVRAEPSCVRPHRRRGRGGLAGPCGLGPPRAGEGGK